MPKFTFTEKGIEQLKAQSKRRSMIVMAIAVSIGSFVPALRSINEEFSWTPIIIGLIIAPLAMLYMSYSIKKRLKGAFDDNYIEIEDNEITAKSAMLNPIHVTKDEITKITETDKGELLISTKDWKKSIRLSRHLDGFEEAKELVKELGEVKKSNFNLTLIVSIVLSVLFLGLFFTFFITENTYLVNFAGALLIVFSAFMMYLLLSNAAGTKKLKLRVFVYIWIMIIVLLKILIVNNVIDIWFP